MTANQKKTQSDPPEQAQFLRLFLSSERELFRYVSALVPSAVDAEEIVQQAAVVLWEKFDQYDPHQPFTPWACRFALNVAKQWMARRQRWKTLLDGNLAEELLQRRHEMLPVMESRLQHLDACMNKLPRDQWEIIESYYFRRVGVEAIGRETRRSVEAIYKALQRIRRSLRECIEKAALNEA
jgi:RNA polymerase sigma-70 factor (ECF subfamily)